MVQDKESNSNTDAKTESINKRVNQPKHENDYNIEGVLDTESSKEDRNSSRPKAKGKAIILIFSIAFTLASVSALADFLSSNWKQEESNLRSELNVIEHKIDELSIQAENKGFTASEMSEMYTNAVVDIEVKDILGNFISTGTGFRIDQNTIATNYHVVEEGRSATVSIANQSYDIIGFSAIDSINDIVLAKIDRPIELNYVVDFYYDYKVGQKVFVIGSPEGLSGTISEGIISSNLAGQTDLIHISAPVSPGSSGSPIYNEFGYILGILKGNIEGQNLNFAVPSKILKSLIDSQSHVLKSFVNVSPETERMLNQINEEGIAEIYSQESQITDNEKNDSSNQEESHNNKVRQSIENNADDFAPETVLAVPISENIIIKALKSNGSYSMEEFQFEGGSDKLVKFNVKELYDLIEVLKAYDTKNVTLTLFPFGKKSSNRAKRKARKRGQSIKSIMLNAGIESKRVLIRVSDDTKMNIHENLSLVIASFQ